MSFELREQFHEVSLNSAICLFLLQLLVLLNLVGSDINETWASDIQLMQKIPGNFLATPCYLNLSLISNHLFAENYSEFSVIMSQQCDSTDEGHTLRLQQSLIIAVSAATVRFADKYAENPNRRNQLPMPFFL